MAALALLAGLVGIPAVASGEPGPTPPSPPQILEVSKAPQAVKIMKQVALSYAPQMSPQARDQDFLTKVRQCKSLLGLGRLIELRHQTLNLRELMGEVSWEDLRRRRWPKGDQVGVTLSVPVWVPPGAKKVATYCGFEKKWQTVALSAPRPCGFVWHVGKMAAINNKAQYRPDRLQLEINSKFAPLVGLLLEYIFREGYYDVSRRVPLLVVRGGEDTFSARNGPGPVAAECLSFPDNEGSSLAATVAVCYFQDLADMYHGRHAPSSNHRLGLALDLNDYNFRTKGVIDGSPNPISPATRQYNRDAMHRLDARNMPGWVYTAAKWLGCRLPQEWNYFGYQTDWEHVDVGTK
ncbi:MAG: hypothetical protein HY790_10750 [Deltaproteobacteria bacterium]|nr:hypothetical protein [Deltaproteobacteria bacterium]